MRDDVNCGYKWCVLVSVCWWGRRRGMGVLHRCAMYQAQIVEEQYEQDVAIPDA